VSDTTQDDPQPAPTSSARPCAWDVVLGWMRDRDQFGQRKYGVRLQPGNGRDQLKDAIDELLDLIAYLAAEWLERQEAQARATEAAVQSAIREALLRVADSVARHVVTRAGWTPDDPCFVVDLRQSEADLLDVVRAAVSVALKKEKEHAKTR
jgi:hypothetical protein